MTGDHPFHQKFQALANECAVPTISSHLHSATLTERSTRTLPGAAHSKELPQDEQILSDDAFDTITAEEFGDGYEEMNRIPWGVHMLVRGKNY